MQRLNYFKVSGLEGGDRFVFFVEGSRASVDAAFAQASGVVAIHRGGALSVWRTPDVVDGPWEFVPIVGQPSHARIAYRVAA